MGDLMPKLVGRKTLFGNKSERAPNMESWHAPFGLWVDRCGSICLACHWMRSLSGGGGLSGPTVVAKGVETYRCDQF